MEITESCLDAETLAAWVDGGLSAPELERAQTHVAECLRCQAMVGTLARIAAAAPAPNAESARRRLLGWPGWPAWLVPLTAAAAAITIYVAIPGSQLDTRVTTALPPAPTAPQSLNQTEASPPVPVPAPSSAAPAATVPERARQTGEVKQTGEARADATAPPPAALDKMNAQTATAVTGELAAASPPAPPPAAPALSETVGAAADAAAGPAAGARAGAAGGAAAARAESRVGGGIPPGSAGRGLAFREALPSVSRDIVSPDPLIRWRLAGSDVEISTNGGATWETTRTGVNTPLTAGAAPSATVVWVVGASGVVLVSADGRTWRRVPFPEITNLSAVRARDARSAAVTTANGRIFSTTDAGATWIQGLQGF